MSRRATWLRRSLFVSCAVVALAATACGASEGDASDVVAVTPTSNQATSNQAGSNASMPLAATPVDSSKATTPVPAPKVPDSTSSPLATAPDLGSALLDPAEQDPGVTPTRLDAPSISIRDAEIVPVGFEASGDLEVPGVDAVGWYRFGAALGRPGSVVLAAHIAFDGVDGIFRHLDDLDPGDVVSVIGADGSQARYRIESVERFRKDALPDDRVWSMTGPPTLVLITCGGRFDRSVGHYEDNVVAFGVPV